jgi:DNA-binding response OmpR family regulator
MSSFNEAAINMADPDKKKNEHDFLIAIVDDHIDLVISISNYLENNGFRTVWAYNGEDALKLCKKESPDMLLLDIRMPGMNGFDIAKLLPKEQKIIFMSGFDELESRSKEFGNCVGTIQKPIDFGKLISRLRAEFGLKKSEL